MYVLFTAICLFFVQVLWHAISFASFWMLSCVQVMTFAEAEKFRFNPFDLTKVWSHKDYPLIPVGRFVLNRNPQNYFAEVIPVSIVHILSLRLLFVELYLFVTGVIIRLMTSIDSFQRRLIAILTAVSQDSLLYWQLSAEAVIAILTAVRGGSYCFIDSCQRRQSLLYWLVSDPAVNARLMINDCIANFIITMLIKFF